ncbi:homocysteine S-methyltransferase [Streptococcus cuniculipharyngis]|uniref:S-methylmethionine:homocysteine methyltransferase n=1 Tax=Streptococcus cuniculipharyngis TaxID=1562651 RepID=A0A5C5SEQ1_9STRE|nr:homocysteine S-methyltransferase [Streptococcus cuniculipharyngis]TWS98770.1 homocysteine S-methyltransferase [Streptococcus cuniculipharyngis]
MGRLQELLEREKVAVLHGALGTELETRGYDVSGKLWSAKYLVDDPQAIKTIHEDYLRVGADIVTTASYQATLPGLLAAGFDAGEAEGLIKSTVKLAKEARDQIWEELSEQEKRQRLYPLIAGDVGPYAAYLADGSEYTGNYQGISLAALKDFHRPRIAWLLEEGVDFLAIETIPNALEIQALVELLASDFAHVECFLSLTTQDGYHLSDGSDSEQSLSLLAQSPQILALGINCSQPDKVGSFLNKISQQTDKPLVTYPNSGEIYDGASQSWYSNPDSQHSLADYSQVWIKQGAKIIGGCCRTSIDDLKELVNLVDD